MLGVDVVGMERPKSALYRRNWARHQRFASGPRAPGFGLVELDLDVTVGAGDEDGAPWRTGRGWRLGCCSSGTWACMGVLHL